MKSRCNRLMEDELVLRHFRNPPNATTLVWEEVPFGRDVQIEAPKGPDSRATSSQFQEPEIDLRP
jgi:hypothetical protein